MIQFIGFLVGNVMKYLNEYLEQKLKIKPLGKVTTILYESEIGVYSGEEILIDGETTNIVVYYIDYIDWLENEFFKS